MERFVARSSPVPWRGTPERQSLYTSHPQRQQRTHGCEHRIVANSVYCKKLRYCRSSYQGNILVWTLLSAACFRADLTARSFLLYIPLHLAALLLSALLNAQ